MFTYPVFFPLSLVLMAGAILLLVRFLMGGFRQRPSWPFQPAYIAGMVLFFLSSWMILLPLYAADNELGRFQTVISSFSSALQEFTIDLGAEEIMKKASGNPPLQLYLAVFIIFSPVLTIGALLSLLKDIFASFRIRLLKHFSSMNIYVFSELSPESAALAESVREEEIKMLKEYHKSKNGGIEKKIPAWLIGLYLKQHMLLIFTDVHVSEEESITELVEQVSKLGALTMKKDITALKLFCNVKTKEKRGTVFGRRVFFIIGRDETENLEQTIKLNDSCREYTNCSLFLFSSHPTAGYILDTLDKGEYTVSRQTRLAVNEDYTKFLASPENAKSMYGRGDCYYFRRVDSIDRLAVSTLRDDTLIKPLFRHAAAERTISLVIAGLGQYGMAFLKNALWMYQIHGYRLCIHIIDAADKDTIHKRISGVMPDIALLKTDLSTPGRFCYRMDTKGDCQFEIRVYSSVDSNTSELNDLFNEKESATERGLFSNVQLVLVALGEDERNIELAVKFRRLFDRLNSVDENSVKKHSDELPIICSIVFDNKTADNLSCNQSRGGIVNYKDIPYHIRFIGHMSQHFNYSDLKKMMEQEAEAVWRHFEWISHQKKLRESYHTLPEGEADERKAEILSAFRSEMDQYFDEENKIRKEKGKSPIVPSEWTVSDLEKDQNPEGIMKEILKYTSYEYFRDSSMARQIHQQMLSDYFNEYFDSFDSASRHRDIMVCNCGRCLARMLTEHARWNAYMRVNGFSYSEVRRDRAKCHSNIKPWYELSAVEKYKD